MKFNFCAYESYQQTNLITHVERHMNARTHSCPHCQVKFSIKVDRKKHIHTHLNVKTYTCTQCCKTFKQKSGLLNHKKIHEEATIQCEVWDKNISSSSKLKLHQIRHYESKCFNCEKCDKPFKRMADLKRHGKLSCLKNIYVAINYACQHSAMKVYKCS